MSGRNLTNGSGFANRNLTNTTVNQLSDISADLPIIYDTDFKISLKGLSSLGASDANKVIKVNSSGNSLEYADDVSRTDAEIRGLFSGISPISYNNSNGQISTTFTADSSDTLENKSGNISMFTNNENYIKLTNLSGVSPISYNNSNGQISTTFTADSSDTLENKSGNISMFTNNENYIKLTGLSASNPITYNNATGAIGWTNSNNYIALTNLSGVSPISYNNSNGQISTTFTASSSDTLTNKSGSNSMFSNDESYIKLTSLSGISPISYNNSNGQISTTFTADSTTTITNKSISYDQLTGTPTIPNLTTATDFGTSAGSSITIGSTNRHLEIQGSSIDIEDGDGTTKIFITDEDVKFKGSDVSIQGISATRQPRLFFTNFTNPLIDNYIALQGANDADSNGKFTLTLPQITDTLITKDSVDTLTNKSISYSQLTGTPTIPTNNLTLTNGAGYITADSTNTLTNKSISYSQLTGTPTIPDLTTAVNFGTSAGSLTTIGNSSQITKIDGNINLSGTIFTQTFFNNTIKIGNGNSSSGFIQFQEDTDSGSNYVILQPASSLADNYTLTLPSITDTLITKDSVDTLTNKSISYSQLTGTPTIPTNNNQLTNGAGYITSSSISSFITATSTETLENKTLKSPIFTSQSGAYEKMILKDENLSHNINIFTPNLTDHINIGFPSATGTLAITDNIPTNNNELTNGSGYITASSTETLTNKSIAYTQLTGTPTIPTNNNQLTNGAGYITSATNYWELSSVSLAPTSDTYNVIIGQKANANSNNVELLVYGDAEIKNKLRSSSDTEIYLNFDTTYGVKCFGKYYAPNTTSYNMSFQNTQTSSIYPFIGVSNVGDFIIHIETIGDILRVKKDKNIEIVDGDLIGTATGNFAKARMNDIYCRNIYAEPIVISNGSSSSAYILMYEDADNGTNYTKLQATASIGSNNTLTLPENTGTLISSASNNLCADATSTISIASSSNPRHLDIYTPEIEVSTLGDTNAFIEMRSGTGNASSSYTSTLKLYNKNNTKSAFLGLDSGDEAFFVNNSSNNSGETKLSLNAYSTFATGYYISTKAYPLTYRSSINSTYYAHFYTTSSHSNGFHISSVGDSWETLLSRDIKYYDTDFSGETNGVASYAKLQMGDIFMEDLFAEALNYTSATQVSDARLKINLKPIENAIDTLNKLTPLIYDKKVKEEDDLWGKEYQKESGLIAQDVYNEVPELKFIVNNVAEDISSNFDSSGNLVRDCCGWDIVEDQPRREYPIEVDASGNPTENSGKLKQEATYKKVKNPNKKLSINYEDLIAYLIKGVQDLSKQVNQQQAIIDKLLSSSSFKEFMS